MNHLPSFLFLVLPLLLAACANKDADTADPDVDTDTDPSAEGQTMAVITTVSSDYATGSFATVDLDSGTITDEIFLTSGDPAVSAGGGWVFQINRYNYDNLRVYAPGSWGAPLWEQDLGDLSNPQEAEVCEEALFVTLYGRDHLGVYDLQSGLLTGTVDLSAFADGDEVGPEAASLVALGGKLYAGLNRLNRSEGWTNAGGRVVEIDCARRAVTRSWPVGGNTRVSAWPGTARLLVQATAHGEDPGGLYRLDPGADTVELIVESPGERFSGVAAVGEGAIAIALADDHSRYTVYCIDLAAGVADVLEETGSYLTGVAQNDRGEAWISAGSSWLDDAAPSGIFRYDIASCTPLASAPLSFGLYPFDVAFY